MMRRSFAVFAATMVVCTVLGTCTLNYLTLYTDAVTIDDEVTLVTIDALPDVVLKADPSPASVAHPVRPAAPRVQPAAPMPVKAPLKPATLPASCADIKWYNAKYGTAQLEAMRIAWHIKKPSPEQRKLIEQCLAS